MIYIIDGTGEHDSKKYFSDMSRGFCWKIHKQSSGSVYLRGPEKFGTETWEIGDNLYKIIMSDRERFANPPITLVGHSRGGAACIYVAHKLKTLKININAMLLFDAVDRALGFDADVIPSNVARCLHLMRDEAFSNYFINTPEYKRLKHNQTIPMLTTKEAITRDENRIKQLERYNKAMRDACRFDCDGTGFSFGNAGTKYEPPCKAQRIRYRATHGAMGGAPLQVSKYIDDFQYAKAIEYEEIDSMLHIQTKANSFLKEVGESGNLKLDYIPACMPYDQTTIRERIFY
jgi:hypothetical protein